MSSIDQRVVQMLFDNAAFEKGVAITLSSLDRLNKGLQLQGATKGLNDVGDAANRVSLGGLTSGIDAASEHFKAMSVIGIAALATITSKVVNAGIAVTKAFVIDPVKDGFANYETQINAVQTILANTGLVGEAGLSKVNKVLAQLNTYANQTVYNFSDMAKNIGTFTAAGVGLQDSVNSIKGIANLAALSGSSSEQASTAMYQLSQAIASGKVQLQDWNSVVNAGLGGKVFQTALENTARASGVAIDSIIKKSGSFRNSLQEGWLTSGILTKTLSQFTGDLSAAQLKSMGFTAQQAQQILQLGQTAVNAATKIKTMTQLTQALKEEVGTAYASIFKTIFGDIGQATDLFSSIHNVAENALTKPIYDLNTLLQSWEALGGRTVLIQAISDAFKILASVVHVVEQAFREVFPATTASQLYNLTTGLKQFIDMFKIGANTADELKRTLAGVFSIFSIGIFIIKQIVITLADLIGYAGKSSGGVLNFTARVGDLLVKFKNLVEGGDAVNKFFGVLGKILAVPIQLLQLLGQYIGQLYDKIEGHTPSKALGSLTDQLGPIGELIHLANVAWGIFTSHLTQIEGIFAPLAHKFDSFFVGLAHSIMSSLGSLNFQDVVSLINTGLFASVALLLKKFVDKFRGGGGGLGDIVKIIKESFETLNKTFETMQKTLKAATLLEIAAAVALLTISVVALSKIDTQGLIRASSAITVMFAQLMGSLLIFDKFIEGEGWVKLPIMMGSLILLATAVDILAAAVVKLARLDWAGLSKGLLGLSVILGELVLTIKLMGDPEGLIARGLGLAAFAKGVNILATAVTTLSGLSWTELAKGLTGVSVLLASLGLFSKFAEANATGLLAGAGIILLATAIKILASAMGDFSKFSWEQIGKGLASMAGGLGLIAAALRLIPPSSVISAAGVLIVAASLGMIGTAIGKMGSLNWGTIGKGLTSLAGALTLIAGALYVLPPSTLISAAAIFVVAASLGLVADALAKMGAMSWGAIAKSLVELAGSLGIIANALLFMEGALPGAAALLVCAAALEVLLPVLQALGNMSWAQLGEGLAGLAGVFIVFGAAGLVLAPLTPILLALGAAIALIGAGMALAGLGVFLFATALTALSVAGAAGAAALVAIVTAMLALLPEVGKGIGLAVIAFATTIGAAAPAVASAMTKVLVAMLDAIATIAPKLVATLLSLLVMLLQQLSNYVPKMVAAGVNLLVGILQGIANSLGRVITAGANVVIAWLRGIGDQIPRVIQAGFDLILKFINSLTDAINKNAGPLGTAGGNLAKAIIEGLVKGIGNGVGVVADAAKNLAGKALSSIGNFLGIHSPSLEFMKLGEFSGQGFALGLDSMVNSVGDSSENLGKKALLSMSKSISGMSDLIQNNVDAHPTITPVLDLTEVKKNSAKIGDMLTAAPIDIGSSYLKAKIASAGYTANQDASTQTATTAAPTTPGVSFTQNNYSPKALSPAEIYRQTNNQLSKVRGVLVYQSGGNEQPG